MTDVTKLQGLLRSSLRPGWLENPPGDAETARTAANAHQGLVRVAEDFLAAQEALASSPDYTAKGRHRQGRKIAEVSRQRLAKEKWSVFVDQVRRKRDALRKSADTGPSIQDPAARAIVYASVWQMIDASDPVALRIMARDALARGDLTSFEGILSLPSIHKAALDPDTIAELETERLESINPDVAGDLARMNEVVGDLERLLADVEAMTDDPAPDYEREAQEARDALAELAMSETGEGAHIAQSETEEVRE